MNVTGKVGAAIFSPGSQRDCAVGIVLEGSNAEDAYNVSDASEISNGEKRILSLYELLTWFVGRNSQPSVTMTVDEFRNVLEAVFTTE